LKNPLKQTNNERQCYFGGDFKEIELNTRQLIKTETQLEGYYGQNQLPIGLQTDALLNLQIKNHSSR
jgi:hypothetical protein